MSPPRQRPLLWLRVLALLVVASFALLLTTDLVWAQPRQGTSTEADDEDVLPPYSGVGIGYVRLMTMVDYGDLNALSGDLGLGPFSGLFATDLVSVLFTPSFIENFRISLYAGGGSDRTSRRLRLHDSEAYTRTLYFENSVIACGVDYATRLDEPLTLFVGMTVGWGHCTVGLSQARPNGERFRGLFDSSTFRGDSSNGKNNLARSARIESLHLFLYPSVNLEYVVGSNVMVRVGVGYNASVRSSSWIEDGGTELEGSPDFNARGPSFALGVFVGLFPR